MITTKEFVLHKKGKEKISGIEDHNNYVITTNSEFSVIIEAKDRRFFCLSASVEKANDTEYFNALQACFNQPNAGRVLYDHLMLVDIPPGWRPNNPPITEYKERQIEQSEGTVLMFMKASYLDPSLLFGYLRDKIPEEGSLACRASRESENFGVGGPTHRSGYIRVEDFHTLYARYCQSCGHEPSKTLPRLYFLREILKRFGNNRGVDHIKQLNFRIDQDRKAGVYISAERIGNTLCSIFPSLRNVNLTPS